MMKSIPARLGFPMLLLPLLSGAACSGLAARRVEHAPGKVLVLPPRDVVQNGVPHPAGSNSGRQLQQDLIGPLARLGYEAILQEGGGFDHATVAPKSQALAAAKAKGGDYCLQLVLGEFLDAAPMTFRADWVTLQQGFLWSVRDGSLVWSLTEPATYSKSNIGSYRELLDNMARDIAASIAP